jgi:hypothetical protein
MNSSSSQSGFLKSLGGALLLSAFSTAAQAVTLVHNFDTEGTDAASEMTGLSQYYATQFTTGASEAVISTATVLLYNGDNQSHSLAAYFYSDSAGLPGALLATSATASIPNGMPSEATFDFGAFGVNAHTSYWLVYSLLEPTNVQSVYGPFTSENAETSAYGWTIGWDSARSGNSGETWTLDTTDLSVIRLEGTLGAIPEPSTCASLAGLAVGAVALGLRRRRGAVTAT